MENTQLIQKEVLERLSLYGPHTHSNLFFALIYIVNKLKLNGSIDLAVDYLVNENYILQTAEPHEIKEGLIIYYKITYKGLWNYYLINKVPKDLYK